MKNERMIISSKLRELRRSRNMTQTKLARRAGLYDTTIAKMEKGTREISATELATMARILDVNMNVFFYRDPVFTGIFEETVIESLSLLSDVKMKRVIDVLKLDLFLKSKRAKGDLKLKYKKMKGALEELRFDE